MTMTDEQTSEPKAIDAISGANKRAKLAIKRQLAREPDATVTSSGAPKDTPHPSKISVVMGLLVREEGATFEEMIAVTGWKPHSTRAVLTGLRKKGYTLERSKRDDVTRYRITDKA